MSDVEKMREALKKGKSNSKLSVYDDAEHGFHADYRRSKRGMGSDAGLVSAEWSQVAQGNGSRTHWPIVLPAAITSELCASSGTGKAAILSLDLDMRKCPA